MTTPAGKPIYDRFNQLDCFRHQAQPEPARRTVSNSIAAGEPPPRPQPKPTAKPGSPPPFRDEQAARYLLSRAMQQGVVVTLCLRGGKTVQGIIHRYDSFTIAIHRAEDQRLVLLFKHAIDSIEFPESFQPEGK